MITYTSGNFFDYDADIRVNTVNCVGVMGAGAALQFKNKYPQMFSEYVRECNLGKVKIGLPHVWTENEIFSSKQLTIINFPTKDHWRKPSEYDYVEKGLAWLKEYLSSQGSSTVTLPALGCGHGGLDWNIVKELIEKYLSNLNTNILVFEPASSLSNDIKPEDADLLLKKNIIRLFPTDLNYPKGLKGRTAFDIYLKGDANVFNQKTLSIIVDSKAEEKEKIAVINCIKALPSDKFTFLLGFNSSFEIDLVKFILERKSKVIIVLPYGILELKIRKDLANVWDEKLITIVSTSSPRQIWKVNESINALKFRIKVSDAILIGNYEFNNVRSFMSEFEETQGTIFYINYWNQPNPLYENIYAIQIGKHRNSNEPNISPILEHLRGRFLMNRLEVQLKAGEQKELQLSKMANVFNTVFYIENLTSDKNIYQVDFEVYNAQGQRSSQAVALMQSRVRKFVLLPPDQNYLSEYLFIRIKSNSARDLNISLSIIEYNRI